MENEFGEANVDGFEKTLDEQADLLSLDPTAWLTVFEPGEVAERTEWLASWVPPTPQDLRDALDTINAGVDAGTVEGSFTATVALGDALDLMADLFMSEQNEDGSFKYTSRQVWNMVSALSAGESAGEEE